MKTRFWKVLYALLVFMVTALMPSRAMAQKLVFDFESYPPYEFVENSKVLGTDVDIIREVCKRIGYEAVFMEKPWKRCEEEVKAGDVDAIFSLFKTDEREQYLYFPVESLSFEKDMVIAKKGKGKAGKIEDLNGKTIGSVVGYSYGDAFDEAAKKKSFRLEECQNNEQMLKKLIEDRMDFGIINELVYNNLVKKLKLTGKIDILYTQVYEPMFVGFSKAKGDKAKEISDNFGKVLSEMRKKGDIKKILENY